MKMNLNFTWKKKTGQYQHGESLYLNRINVGGYDYNIARSQHETDDSNRYAGYVELPSLSTQVKRVYGATPEEIKNKVEQVVKSWFTEALKEETMKNYYGVEAKLKGYLPGFMVLSATDDCQAKTELEFLQQKYAQNLEVKMHTLQPIWEGIKSVIPHIENKEGDYYTQVGKAYYFEV